MQLNVVELGTVGYEEALLLQRGALAARKAGLIPDTLLLCSHTAVITLGSSAKPEHILSSAAGIAQFEVERGGDVTAHDEAQLIFYPILDLHLHKQDIHWYLRMLEEVMIRTAAIFGVTAHRIEGKTGVWCQDRKIGSLGVKVSKWCTMHGGALNLNKSELFKSIVPCGLYGVSMTSLEQESGHSINFEEALIKIKQSFISVLAYSPEKVSGVQASHLTDRIKAYES